MKNAAGRIIKFYSSIIAKNIPLFLAAGLLSLLPYEESEQAAQMIYRIALPLLMGYMAGKKAGMEAGGLAGCLASVAVVIAEPASAVLASIAAGGLAGCMTFRVYEWAKERIPVGFEMLFRHFLIVLGGLSSAVLAALLLVPALQVMDGVLGRMLAFMVERGWIPWASIVIEPMKILFLNNWINHGFLVPIGLEQARETGYSMLFLLEANPGPGLGILAASFIANRRRGELSSGMVIEFFGGIHEVYFPYVLADLRLLAAVTAGGIVGNFFFAAGGVGLAGPASPGSVLTILLLCEKSRWLWLAVGIAGSGLTAGAIAWFLVRNGRQTVEEEKDVVIRQEPIRRICFVCDAGIGSSAMGAALLRRKLKSLGIAGVEVMHVPVDEIPADADLLVCQRNYAARMTDFSGEIMTVENLMDGKEYEELTMRLKGEV